MTLLECKVRLHLSEETISSWNGIQVLSKENHLRKIDVYLSRFNTPDSCIIIFSYPLINKEEISNQYLKIS